MRTDDYGREIAQSRRKSNMLGGGRLFTFGLALGVGMCFGMGPPLPLLDSVLPAAIAGEPTSPEPPVLPRQWLVLRNALIDPSVTGVAYAKQEADMRLLHEEWVALRDALTLSCEDRIASR